MKFITTIFKNNTKKFLKEMLLSKIFSSIVIYVVITTIQIKIKCNACLFFNIIIKMECNTSTMSIQVNILETVIHLILIKTVHFNALDA